MKVVIDTNVLLVSIARSSKYRWIFDLILKGKVELLLSNEIMNEYFEIIAMKADGVVAQHVINALLLLPNVTKIDIYYHWNLIAEDSDDNKFVDCAVAGNAAFIVSEDKHFRNLSSIGFPVVKVLSIEDFYKAVNA